MLGALLAGLGLVVSDVTFLYLQPFVLIPWLFALRASRSPKRGALLGLVVGVAQAVPLVWLLEFPLPLAAGLVAYAGILWALFSAIAAWLFRGPAVLAAFAVGGAAVLVEWLDLTIFPMWGTAQVYTRVWSEAPALVQFVGVTGVLGIVFLNVAGQALFVALRGPSGKRAGWALGALVAFWGLQIGATWMPMEQSLRVAAIGWTDESLAPAERTSDRSLFESVVAPHIKEAARQGARLVVLPETAFSGPEAAALLSDFRALAAENDLVIAVGWYAQDTQDNRVAFIGPKGRIGEVYRKTHLIRGLETYHAGDGAPVVVEIDGVKVGVLICQDDNFTDLARGLAREGAQLVVVPTRDWKQVRHQHFRNARFRSLENRVGYVRAAANGVSAMVDGRGSLVASVDHFAESKNLVVAKVPVGSGGAVYSHTGDWLMLAIGVLLVAAGIRAVRVGGPSRP
jgi:apolipoprotein N-acyltransferase